MGGGLINFPTRFLRWVKINGDSDGSDDGGGSSSDSDVFFVPATIQPKYFIDEDDTEPVEIKNYTSDIRDATFLYNKEDMLSLGIEEGELNSLTPVTIDEAYNDCFTNNPTKGLYINKEIFTNTIVLDEIIKGENYSINLYSYSTNGEYIVYKISDDIFLTLKHTQLV